MMPSLNGKNTFSTILMTFYRTVQALSTVNTSPLTNFESSEARNSAAAAKASIPNLSKRDESLAVIPVIIDPGAIAF